MRPSNVFVSSAFSAFSMFLKIFFFCAEHDEKERKAEIKEKREHPFHQGSRGRPAPANPTACDDLSRGRAGPYNGPTRPWRQPSPASIVSLRQDNQNMFVRTARMCRRCSSISKPS